MPKLAPAIYAAHMDSVLKLAKRKEGVSRAQIIEELNVTRAVASGLIDKCSLTKDDALKVGRTEFFVANGAAAAPAVPEPVAAKQSKPPAPAKAEATPESSEAAEEEEDIIAELDAQILDTRSGLRTAAAAAGKALGEWATHQAVVDALRERMTALATKRMNAS